MADNSNDVGWATGPVSGSASALISRREYAMSHIVSLYLCIEKCCLRGFVMS